MINKNALRRVSLACLEISYEMGVIYSARNRISSLKVFHFLLYPRSSIYFFRIFTFYIVFDVVWVRVYKYTKINSREITSLPERKSVAADQITRDCRNYWGGGEGLPMPRHCVIMIFCRTTVSARLEKITKDFTHWKINECITWIRSKGSISQLLNQLQVLC